LVRLALAADAAPVEREVLAVDPGGQRVRGPAHEREREVGAQDLRRGGADDLVQPGQQRGVLDVDGLRRRRPERVEIAGEVELRRQRRELCPVVAIVGLVGVAPLLGLQVQRREARLELEHGRGRIRRQPGVLELRADVLDVRRPQLGRCRALVEVRLAIGQPEPGLLEPQQVAIGVVVIHGHVPAEEREDPGTVQHREQREHVGRLGDASQQRRDRLGARRLDRLQVQPRGERVAEHPVELVVRRGGRGLEQLAQHDLVAPADLLEGAPRAVPGRDGIGIEPAPIREPIEVDAGICRRVPVPRAKAHARTLEKR
jgi:hypothetical protein